ncbi:MAG: hypothetical protein OSJ72_08325 [Lachnospiraceae bacterium]|nr:hypothetical protein [Lachnospiraceae bacterium]
MERATWNNYLAQTWDKYLPPIRPYAEETAIFKRYVANFIKDKGKIPSILILGSTPELRDIIYEFDITPTVVDFSRENYEGMSLLLRNKGTDKFIENNWLDMRECNDIGQYDFIFSEAAFNVLNVKAAKQIYHLCSTLLKNNGKLIVKEWIRFSDTRPLLEDLIKDYRESNSTLGFYSYLCIPLMLLFYDFENEVITLKDLDREINKMLSSGKITINEQMSVGIHEYRNVDLELYIPSILEFMNDMKEYLSLSMIHTVHIAHAEFHPIFVYERR